MAIFGNRNKEIARQLANIEAEQVYRDGMMNSTDNPFAPLGELTRRITTGAYQRPANRLDLEADRRQMIAMRLRLQEGESLPFDDIHTSLGKEKVFVFILQNDQAVTLEDDPFLFPSDTLMTQLRLIAK